MAVWRVTCRGNWPNLRHPTFNCKICSSFIQRTSQSCLNHSQGPCEWVNADIGVLWASLQNVAGFNDISSGQTLRIRAELRNFGTGVRKSGAEVEKLGQKWAAWGGSPGLGRHRSVHTKNAGAGFCLPQMLILLRSLPHFADWSIGRI